MKVIDFILGRKPKEVVDEVQAETDPVEEQFLETMSLEPDYDFRIKAQFDGGPLNKQTRYVSGGQATIFVPFSPAASQNEIGIRLLDDGSAIAVYTKKFVGVYYWDGNLTVDSLKALKGFFAQERKTRLSNWKLRGLQLEMEQANVG